MNKRDILGTVGASVAAASMSALLGEGIRAPYAPPCPARLAEDAAFWAFTFVHAPKEIAA